ncbi:unnamed protein product [Thlaspi arvense]|uniref:Uncharacterized protein n=1 Tax=Thlaspi arvense TaxID=13288 RepID=A0AAU9R7B9_THLAR|nr:unnamed protein product [Thlaspi arvense]
MALSIAGQTAAPQMCMKWLSLIVDIQSICPHTSVHVGRIQCKHVVCVLDDNQEDPMLYVAEYYYTHVLKNTYKDNIKPINGERLWIQTNKPLMGIPDLRKSRECRKSNKTWQATTFEPVVVEGPKNKRGRPYKHPAEVNPNPEPPPKPRKKCLAQTNSQPAPATSSQAEPKLFQVLLCHHQVNHQSNMQKSNIPQGVRTLSSPFTDRVFEVFGNRFYNRFTSNSQPPEDLNSQSQCQQNNNVNQTTFTRT